eukprot:TRINITY_DN64574_c0_g1_i1.p2 TRINITY_DN64574_c0_g1~~TRINITY_DN64574_c0_g1_i1.p2  ORF type:complete len:133 (+),score=32.23 TRINITY_DN64574_c0_g1_i1:97-495(+)
MARFIALAFAAATVVTSGVKVSTKTEYLALDSNSNELMVVKASSHQAPCDGIKCGNLQCPTGFAPTTVKGHCCPYCVNPNIKVEAEVTGATGKNGGKQSAFCADVWCFPTLCEKEEVMPTTANGQCCPSCPK